MQLSAGSLNSLILSITTDELSAEPQSSLRRILSFIGATPDCTGLTGGGTTAAVESGGVERTKKSCSTQLEQRAQTRKH